MGLSVACPNNVIFFNTKRMIWRRVSLEMVPNISGISSRRAASSSGWIFSMSRRKRRTPPAVAEESVEPIELIWRACTRCIDARLDQYYNRHTIHRSPGGKDRENGNKGGGSKKRLVSKYSVVVMTPPSSYRREQDRMRSNTRGRSTINNFNQTPATDIRSRRRSQAGSIQDIEIAFPERQVGQRSGRVDIPQKGLAAQIPEFFCRP
ncbi:hypothetical protein B0H17DRAFT_1128316 [Mycena rosella]|uniref:Uncharacterized protein n=1 Tax=Mycena rosella TaxID=1033263 RepID=A0AAD7GM57_MYCRO|nr:hypothetical protein B0H17DRAFT_1128316 [Mycena rosella]